MRTKIKNANVVLFGNPRGSYQDKFNRAAKLAKQHNVLSDKLDRFISVEENTQRSICALMCKVMLETGIRVGNDESAEGYQSLRKGVGFQQTFGLTTLKTQHVRIRGSRITMDFTGKRGIEQVLKMDDLPIAKKIRQLIKDSEDGFIFPVSDYILRKFVRKYVGNKFYPKDFRTLSANVIAFKYYMEELKGWKAETKKEVRQEIKWLVEEVAEQLGNTPAIARRSYIDPRLLEFVTNKITN